MYIVSKGKYLIVKWIKKWTKINQTEGNNCTLLLCKHNYIYYILCGWNLDGIIFACFDTIHCNLKKGGSFQKKLSFVQMFEWSQL